MTRNPGRVPTRLGAVAVAVLGGLLLATAAAASSPLRVVVLVSDVTDEKVLTRIRGHASDLPVTFTVTRGRQGPSPAADLTQQLAAVLTMAGGAVPDAVIWFSHGRCPDSAASAGHAEQLVVHIGQPKTRSVLVRTTGDSACGDAAPVSAADISDSAVLEGAAIAVRTALLALSEGGTIGIVRPAPGTPQATDAPELRPIEVHPRVLVGWMGAADGLSTYGQQGGRSTVAVGGTTWAGELGLAGTVPVAVKDTQGTVSLSRLAATLGLVHRLPFGEHWEGSLAMHGGVCLVMRSTILPAVPDPKNPEPQNQWVLPLVAPEVRVAWAIAGLRGAALVLTLGADILPWVPPMTVTYVESNGTEHPHVVHPWWVQPRAGLGVEFRL